MGLVSDTGTTAAQKVLRTRQALWGVQKADRGVRQARTHDLVCQGLCWGAELARVPA